jgi:hypothetical protein
MRMLHCGTKEIENVVASFMASRLRSKLCLENARNKSLSTRDSLNLAPLNIQISSNITSIHSLSLITVYTIYPDTSQASM